MSYTPIETYWAYGEKKVTTKTTSINDNCFQKQENSPINNINEENVDLLQNMDFVFICIDSGESKKMLSPILLVLIFE